MRLLADLMRRFVSGEDRSSDLVDQIEGVLIEYFRESELYDELSGPVAMYSPQGGEYLYDQEQLAREFQYALKRLEQEGELED